MKSKLEELKNLRVDFFISLPNDESNYWMTGSTSAMDTDQNNGNTVVLDANLTVDFYFEKHQYIRLDIFKEEEQIDTLGMTLGKIMGAKQNTLEYQLSILEEVSLIVKAISIKEEVKNSIVRLEVNLNLVNLPYSDYFLVLSNLHNEGAEQKVWKSEECTGKEIVFEANNLYLYDICLGDLDKIFILDLYRVFHGHMCRLKTTLNKIKTFSNDAFPLESIEKQCKVATMKINFEYQNSLRFIDYIELGLQVCLVVAVDFTSSNGACNLPSSLHYIYGKDQNNYEQAITTCGSIVAFYDLDNLFPLYGFGGVLPKSKYTNHCFNLNFKPNNPNVVGMDGIISAYKKALTKVQLDGPTYFSPIIKNMIQFVKSQLSKTVYYILLILTDGQIHDMQQTKDCIVEASKLPISIIIVGIGEDDFANMVELDGDDVAIKNKKGEKSERDIVQFIRFNDYKNNFIKLSEEVLEEVPIQVEQFYRKNKAFRNFAN